MLNRGIKNRRGISQYARSCHITKIAAMIMLCTIILFTSTAHASIGNKTSDRTQTSSATNIAGLTDGSVKSIPLPKSDNSPLSDNKTATLQYAAVSDETEDNSSENDQVQPEDVQIEPMDMQAATGGGGSEAISDLSISSIYVSMVGNTGSAVTSIPISVPPGRKGIEPRLALNYNSTSRNGWIGVGWTLDMGAIQRSTKRGVDYTPDESDDVPDYVAIVNGSTSELVKRSTWNTLVDGISYAGYQAKIEGAFVKYLYNSANGWLAITKDGTKYYYGKSSISRQDNVYGVFKWCLDRVEDTNGNYMTISYSKDQGAVYLDKIEYSKNVNGTDLNNYVKFWYEGRNDVQKIYTTHYEVKIAKRLKTIELGANGDLVRVYKLGYDADLASQGEQYSYSTWRSLLGSVQQFGNDAIVDASGIIINKATASKLPALSIGWKPGSNGTFQDMGRHTTWEDWGTSTSSYPVINGDFNGDGNSDFIRMSDTWFRVYLSNGNGTFQDMGRNPTWEDWDTSTGNYPVISGDFNGDGNSDFIRISNTWFRVYLSNGNGTFQDMGRHPTWEDWDTSTGSYPIISGDFNGNGISDFIRMSNPWFRVYQSEGEYPDVLSMIF